MPKDTSLPDDINALKALLTEQQNRNGQLEAQILSLQEQLNLAIARRYAASSEKITSDQLRLFDEAEVDIETAFEDDTEVNDTITIEAYTRTSKRGRKPLPESLPRVDMLYELDETERVCDHDGALSFVIGRKNWLFSQSVKGVKASANLYSLIETAKANGLEPYAYLRYLFAILPKAQTVKEIEKLLPGNIQAEHIAIK